MHTSMKRLVFILLLSLGGIAEAGEVSRAQFSIGIDNREPVSVVETLDSKAHNSISFFTELNDMTGSTITHQWTHKDKVMFEKSFEVKSERWRVWTSKTLIPAWTGTWTVNVLNDENELIASKSFEYL